MNILQALERPEIFQPWFKGDSWLPWKAFLASLFGLPMDTKARSIYKKHTGRQIVPRQQAREAWVVAGRRAGKSRIAALVACFLAAFRDYGPHLAPGERGTLMIIACDRRQSRVILRYIRSFFEIPLLAGLVERITQESIDLRNRVSVEVHITSFRSTRGYAVVAVVCDEIAFWRSEESAASPDFEILNGLRPGMSTIPGALLLAISSPYARRGALWETYRKHYAKDGDPILVWQADTLSMNPNVDPQVITGAYESDEASAAAEYGGLFRKDIESFAPREAVEACIIPGRFELPFVPPQNGTCYRYVAFVDPSGGSADSFTLAVAHREKDTAVLDAIRETKPPFSPEQVVTEFAELLKQYRISTVHGDKYAGEFPRELFRKAGIQYVCSLQSKSEIYKELLPLLNSGKAELLDHPRLLNQLCSLERRTARGGKDSIDHSPNAHDDLVNAAAGALTLAASGRTRAPGDFGLS